VTVCLLHNEPASHVVVAINGPNQKDGGGVSKERVSHTTWTRNQASYPWSD